MDKKSLGINMNKTLVREMDAGLRLDKWIRNNFSNVTQSFIEKQLRTGKIKVNGEKVKASLRVDKGDEITVVVSVKGKSESQKVFSLNIEINNQNNIKLVTGESKVKVVEFFQKKND